MSEAKIIKLFPVDTKPEKPAKPAPKKKPRTSVRADGLFQRHVRYRDMYGRPRSKIIYGSTEAEADAKRKEFLKMVDLGLRVDKQNMTVAMQAEDWLKTKENLRYSTKAGCKNCVRVIKEAIGDRPLSTVLPSDLKQILSDNNHKSKSYISKLAIALKGIFGMAAEDRLIAHDPSVRLKASGGSAAGGHRAIEQWEQDIIEEVSKTHRVGKVAMLMLWGGLRPGEAIAFDTTVDIVKDQLSITKAIEYQANKSVIKAPKTEAGIRRTPIYPKLREYLGKGPALTMATAPDKPVTQSAFNRAWDSFIYQCEVKLNGCYRRWKPEGYEWKTFTVRPHDLRVTWFTMLYDTGVDEKVAALWGGHADINVTRKIYQKIRLERKQKEEALSIKRLQKSKVYKRKKA